MEPGAADESAASTRRPSPGRVWLARLSSLYDEERTAPLECLNPRPPHKSLCDPFAGASPAEELAWRGCGSNRPPTTSWKKEGGAMNPESHLRYHRERHADLLREARESELAAKFVKTPRSRRSFLASGIWRKRFAGQLTLGRA